MQVTSADHNRKLFALRGNVPLQIRQMPASTEIRMIVTNQMLEAALRKAVEAGLLPRDALRGESFGEREVIRHVLQAPLNAGI